jgi:pilus assembly protein Flp/PilA
MRKSLALLKRFAREENGASMVEYAVLISLIGAALVATIALLEADITALFNNVRTTINPPAAG